MRLGLRSEVFRVGVLPVDLLNLQDADVGSLVGKLLAPKPGAPASQTAFLKYASWLRYACIIFNCDEHTARLYFETFLMVHRTTYKKRHSAKPILSVDSGEFLVFLYLQKFRQFAARPSSGAKSAANLQFEFFSRHLATILSLLRDPANQLAQDRKAAGGGQGDVQLRRHEFTRLTFLVLASSFKGKPQTELDSFVSLAPFWRVKPNALVPLETLCQWTLKHFRVDVNEHAMAGTGLSTRPLVRTVSISHCSSRLVRLDSVAIRGCDVHIDSCSKTTVHLDGLCRFVTVSNCTDCTLNLGACRKMVIVRDCRRVKVATVARGIQVANTQNSTLYLFSWTRPVFIGETLQIRVAPYNTYYPGLAADLRVSNLDPEAPNMWNGAIIFDTLCRASPAAQRSKKRAPGSVPALGEAQAMDTDDAPGSAAAAAGGSKKRQRDGSARKAAGGMNRGGRPYRVRHLGVKSAGLVDVLSPERFFMAPYEFADVKSPDGREAAGSRASADPATTTPRTMSCPFALPDAYAKAATAQRDRVLAARASIERAGLTPEQRTKLHRMVHVRFQQWLRDTNRLRDVENLVQYRKAASAQATSKMDLSS